MRPAAYPPAPVAPDRRAPPIRPAHRPAPCPAGTGARTPPAADLAAPAPQLANRQYAGTAGSSRRAPGPRSARRPLQPAQPAPPDSSRTLFGSIAATDRIPPPPSHPLRSRRLHRPRGLTGNRSGFGSKYAISPGKSAGQMTWTAFLRPLRLIVLAANLRTISKHKEETGRRAKP